jgi:DNA translocase ftsK
MGNRDNRFRVLAVVLSILFFCIGIVLTLGIFLPIAGLAQSHYALFAVGQRVFSVYGFSSFLIPLLFLYGAVLLLIPGWSRESKAVLLGVPLYFITAIIGERLIYAFAPSVSIPIIRQFVTVSILICALLLICFEIFLMLTLSEKLPSSRHSLRNADEEDHIPQYPQNNEAKREDSEEKNASLTQPAPTEADTAIVSEAAENVSDVSDVADVADVAEKDTAEYSHALEEDGAERLPDNEMAPAEVPVPPVHTANAPVNEARADTPSAFPQEYTAGRLQRNDEHSVAAASDVLESPKSQNERQPTNQPAPIQTEQPIEPPDTGRKETRPLEESSLEALPLLEGVEEETQPLPLSTPVSAVMDIQKKAAVRPVFDPSDPNNLFTSLEEITAPVERIKQTGAAEMKAHPLPSDAGATLTLIPPVEEVPAPPVEAPRLSTENVAADDTEESALQMDRNSKKPIPENETVAVGAQTATDVSDTDIVGESVAAEQFPSVVVQTAQAEPTVASQSESELPLVFVNGVPLPNGRSDILDTMVVIDSEAHSNAEASPGFEAPDFEVHANAELNATAEPHTTLELDTNAESHTDTIQEAQSDSSETDRSVFDEGGIPVTHQRVEPFQNETETTAIKGIEAEVPAKNYAEADTAVNDFDTQDAEDTERSEADADIGSDAAQNTDDDEFLETIEPTVPVIPAKPAPPPPPRKKYAIPFDLLTNYPDGEYWIVDDATRRAALMLKSTFNEFKIDVSITGIRKGPVVTMFEMLPSPGIKLSKITNLQDNIALRLAASSVRIVAPIPGKHAVGIEVPNKKRSIVSFRELIETDLPEAAKMAIPVVLGKDVTGNPQVLDLAQTPHLLIAGATGSGKSVCVNSIILSILYNRRPDEVKLILVDPKIVELKLYNDIAHLLTPVITEPKRAFQALQYALCEMERRYALLDNMGVRDIKTFNAKIKSEHIATETLPYIVIIIDEFADLMATSGKELEATVARLCAMSRAVGIHLVLATQRPSIDVITGLIKANIPSRIAFMVASKTDSRIILDEMGAEKLLGKGDMLYVSAARPFPTRMQGAFVSEQEVERVVACVKEYCEPEYIDDEIFVDDDDEPYDNAVFSDDNDPLYDQALEIVTFAGKASASYVQRKLKIGYNRAARLIEEMEARGIVGPANGSKPREVIRHV